MEINYQNIAENLIDRMLSDYREASIFADDDVESKRRQKFVIGRLANLHLYESFPVAEIIKLAKSYNETFAFLGHAIDVKELEEKINKRIELENNKGEYKWKI